MAHYSSAILRTAAGRAATAVPEGYEPETAVLAK